MSHPGSADGGAGTGPVGIADTQEKSYQELWLTLARREWASMVLVPADPGGSVERVAQALAEVGRRLSPHPVTAVTPSSLEYGTAMALADIPSFVGRPRLAGAAGWPTIDVPATAVGEPKADEAMPAAEPVGRALALTSSARLIISLPAVVSEPLGLATTRTADVVLICVELGRTKLADARRTLKLIGRERVAGCILLR